MMPLLKGPTLKRRWSLKSRDGCGFHFSFRRACEVEFGAFEKIKGIFSITSMEVFRKSRECFLLEKHSPDAVHRGTGHVWCIVGVWPKRAECTGRSARDIKDLLCARPVLVRVGALDCAVFWWAPDAPEWVRCSASDVWTSCEPLCVWDWWAQDESGAQRPVIEHLCGPLCARVRWVLDASGGLQVSVKRSTRESKKDDTWPFSGHRTLGLIVRWFPAARPVTPISAEWKSQRLYLFEWARNTCWPAWRSLSWHSSIRFIFASLSKHLPLIFFID
jgi:hypothetical protein